MSNTSTTSVTKCRARAHAYLTELIGSSPEALTWDATHPCRATCTITDRSGLVSVLEADELAA